MRIREWREVEAIHGDLSQYRIRVVSLLRKYFKMSVELGRLPSLIGKEFFRCRVTSYSTNSFEDAVIYVHDMERSLELISQPSQRIITRIIFQEYSQEETARLVGIPIRSFGRHLAKALDELSEVLLARGLMEHSQAPISASRATELSRHQEPPKMPPVSVTYLMSLSNPKFCQARKYAKSLAKL